MSDSNSQASFSFLDEVEKIDPPAKPNRKPLRPPKQIEVTEDSTQPVEQEAVGEAVIPASVATIGESATWMDEPAQPSDIVDEVTIAVPDTEISIEEDTKEEIMNTEREEVDLLQKVEATEEIIAPAQENGTIETEDEEGVMYERRTGIRGRRSVKQNSLAADFINVPQDEVLFQKQYYSMGEVTAMFKENHSLIRYWESEFDILKPKKNAKGDRYFRPIDVKNLHLIYDLLRKRKFTIEGAKEYLKNNKHAEEKFAAVQSLQKIKNFFLELKANL